MPLKRHPALQDLSRDHQLFLLHALRIRWAVDDDPRGDPLPQTLAAFKAFWQEDGLPHLREEEEITFPFYLEKAPLARRTIQPLLTDHDWLREKMDELADLPPVEVSTTLLKSIAEYITNHVRHEEGVIFEAMQQALDEDALAELGRRSLSFRQEHRTQASIGPATEPPPPFNQSSD